MLQTSTQKRRFEFIGGSSSKFWEIHISGASVRVQFGRIGTIGQAVVKDLANEEAARKHADRLIKEKLGKGYSEAWVAHAKESMKSLLPRFNAQRMVMDYVREFYAPAADRGLRFDDPAFRFRWPAPPAVISEKDRTHPDFDPRSLDT